MRRRGATEEERRESEGGALAGNLRGVGALQSGERLSVANERDHASASASGPETDGARVEAKTCYVGPGPVHGDEGVPVYQVQVRGPLPPDLSERISRVHAEAVAAILSKDVGGGGCVISYL